MYMVADYKSIFIYIGSVPVLKYSCVLGCPWHATRRVGAAGGQLAD